ncbi:M48 family metalloprotease [Legionella bononiensis]|uniref:M48 family metalloprotease n=1 Tax=Legionella bononiensis TaxID=2793102 RepID=A0ABS1WBW7_9GAMM|nr:M48 family metalloprotease [Legionella bononiensis]MBL7481142.1 M48 family metalloprotease [Legionella bononiensis]MBL7526851.1 M48 family metalloprotease [Legionella bononiensis]MBL7564258.1 M48 family metalloprotease [Legionella bononiensis]
MIQLNLKFKLKPVISSLSALGRLFILFILAQPSFAEGLSPYSTKELEQLEHQFIQLINQSDSVERNPLANQFINHIGKKLAYYGRIKTPYFFIVKSREINAFAGPGGYIGINSQLILTTQNESELAAVMAHEIAHVRLHHLYSMIEHQKQMRVPMLASMLASIALGALNPTVGMGAMMASISGFSQDNINFTRSKEKEADRIGIDMLIKAGFDPRGMAAFFRKMQENSRYYYSADVPAILRTHPMDADRIAEAENRTARLERKRYNDSLDYALFKELIRVSVTPQTKQILDYYEHQCHKRNSSIACQYGYVLALLNNNEYAKAAERLRPIIDNNSDNLYFQIAMAQAELGLSQNKAAINRLADAQKNYPDNYAALMAYAQGLLSANQAEKATSVLLKGSRIYKEDLPLCRELARAQAESHQKNYAYFTQSQCLLLEGQHRAAIAQLKVARNLSKNDPYLMARINAKIDEIKYMTEN